MTDRINGLPGSTLSPSAEASRKQGVASRASDGEARAATPADTDRVALTDSARQRLRLEQAVSASPDMNSEKVDTIREQIERGEYRINADEIADRLLHSDDDLTRLS